MKIPPNTAAGTQTPVPSSILTPPPPPTTGPMCRPGDPPEVLDGSVPEPLTWFSPDAGNAAGPVLYSGPGGNGGPQAAPAGGNQSLAGSARDFFGGIASDAIDAAAFLLRYGKPIKLNVPFVSQFDKGKDFKPGMHSCFDAAKSCAKSGGANILDSSHRIQVGAKEDKNGRITPDAAKVVQARNYIDTELEAGRPVMVGVSDEDNNINVDKLTDHFVVITGRGIDDQGRLFYTFNDPGAGNAAKGADTRKENRFFLDANNGNLTRPGDPNAQFVVDATYDLTMVRINAENPNP